MATLAAPTFVSLDELLARPSRWASVVRWSALAGLEMGIIGPFGSYKANVFSRMVYWTALFCVGGLVLWPTSVAALVLGPRRGWPPIFSVIAVVLLTCLPLAALAAAGCYVFWPLHASGMRAVEWYGLTIVVVLPSVAGLLWLELASWRGTQPVQPPGPPAPMTLPIEGLRSEQPLPDHLVCSALCLQMEDHYVRIHTLGRSHLHFAAMNQAVAAMSGRPGLQVHRSWWVARDAVSAWSREGRSVVLHLSNGLTVQVARHRVATLRSEGWLEESRARCAAPTGHRELQKPASQSGLQAVGNR